MSQQMMNSVLAHSDMSRPDLGQHVAPQGHVPTDFGAHHHHKPTKAIIGVAILMVLSFLTYEFRDKTVHPHTSAADQAPARQIVASSNH